MYGSIDDTATKFSVLPRSSHADDVRQQQRHGVADHGLPAAERGRGVRIFARFFVLLAVLNGLAMAAFILATPANGRVAGAMGNSNGRNSKENLYTDQHTALSAESPRSSAPSVDAPLDFTALNYYHVRDGKPGQDYPWLKGVKLIEPHRETTLAVTNARPGFTYRWEVRAGSLREEGEVLAEAFVSSAETATATATAVVVLTHLGENGVVLEELDAAGHVTRRLGETVMVKYVRREIRTLTDQEREELLDAMHQLWALRAIDGDGKEVYGDDYADIWAMNRLHFRASSNGHCDQFHNGLSFLVSHSLLSNTFEYSLQLVNPKLTLPYWDFTVERSSSRREEYDPSKPETMSELLQSSWFGSADPDDHMVKDGRWAFTAPPRVQVNDPTNIYPDVYSKLRAPWNVNDRPYLTRGMGTMCQTNTQDTYPWPTCETHYDLVTSHYDFYSWVWDATYDPHAPVHLWLGGVLDCKETYNSIGEVVGKSVARKLATLAGSNRKQLYTAGFFSCEGRAERNESLFSAGTCGCLGFDLTAGGDYLEVLDAMTLTKELIEDFDADMQRLVVDAVCNSPTTLGDHDQSSSSLGPLFWPLHPTIERMWQFSVLTDTVTDFSWPDSDVTVTTRDGTNYTEVLSSSSNDDVCIGHAGSDVFPYGLLEQEDSGFQIKTGITSNPVNGNILTNREVLKALDPSANMLPYVYDTFKWEHCKADGFDFDDAWGEDMPPSDAIRSPRFKEGAKIFPMFRYMKKIMTEVGEEVE